MPEQIHSDQNLVPQERSRAPGYLRNAIAAGSVAIGTSLVLGVPSGEAPVKQEHSQVDVQNSNSDTANSPEAEQKLVTYTVKPGDSVSEIVSKVYGADDGENIMNNEFYAEEVAAVEGNIAEGQLLQPDQVLELPADITEHSAPAE